MGGIHQRHRDGLAQQRGKGARGGGADLLPCQINGLMLPGNAPAGGHQAHPDPLGGAGADQRILADELRLVQLDAEIQPGFQRGNGVVHLVAVERHGSFEAQGIPCAQAAGNQAEFRAGLPQQRPQRGAVFGGGVDFIAQLAGVSGAGNHAAHPADGHIGDGSIVFFGDLILRQQFGDDLRRFGALQGQLGDGVRDVLCLGAGQQVRLHMGEILVAVGGVHHHEIALLPELVNHQIIHRAALPVAHNAVSHPAHRHIGEIVGQQVVQRVQRGGAGEEHLAHMGHIKQPRLLADRHVLFDDAGAVLHRKQIAGKGNHLAPFLHMNIIQRRFTFHITTRSFPNPLLKIKTEAGSGASLRRSCLCA